MERGMRRLATTIAVIALAAACSSKSGTANRTGLLPASASTSSGTAATDSTAQISTDPSKTPYADRLEMAKTLARRFPGPTDSEPTLGQFGLWAGILVQTAWQHDAQRDRIPNWSVENFTLSVAPSIYARELDSSGGNDPEAICAASAYVRAAPPLSSPGIPDRAAACRSWLRYFLAVEQGQPTATVQHLMWDAHTDSLMSGLVENQQALATSAGTTAEQNFWGSWLEVVLLLADVNFPTGAATSVPARDAVMPNCSPVGSPGCELTQNDLGPKLSFVALLANHPAPIDQIFSMYRQVKSNPAGLLTLGATDPALVQALNAYLAAAGWSPGIGSPFGNPK